MSENEKLVSRMIILKNLIELAYDDIKDNKPKQKTLKRWSEMTEEQLAEKCESSNIYTYYSMLEFCIRILNR